MLEAERRGAAIQREMHALDPRMVEIYDFGDLDGYFFVAMQYVEGRNLAEVLQAEQAIDPNRAAVIALEICEQLAKFHSWQSTVVHGDIKPSNIHIGPQRHRAPARFRHRQNAARRPRRHRLTTSAAPAIARRSACALAKSISNRTSGQ